MPHQKALLAIFATLLLALAACGGVTENNGQDAAATRPDAGADIAIDARGKDDKQPPPDMPPADQLVIDAKGKDDKQPPPDMPLADQTIVPPAKDLKPFALDAKFKVVERFDDPLTAGATAFNFSGTTVYLYQFGGTPAAGKISQADIDAKTGKLGTLSTVLSFSPSLTGTMFASGYLALSPKKFVAAGYTVSTTYDGEIFWGDKGIKTPKKVAARGNYDVIFLDDKTMLINGTGAAGASPDGQAVYLDQEGQTGRKLIKEMGAYSGLMALGTKTVYAGGYFNTGGNKIYGFSLNEINKAITNKQTLSSTDGDLILAGSASDAAALGDDLAIIVPDSSFKFKSVGVIPVTVTGDKLAAGTAVNIITGGGGTASVTKLASDGKRLGLYLKNGTKNELAIIEKK